MIRVTSGDFQRRIGQVQDLALAQPVIITSNGRDRVVLLSAEEYKRLRSRDRQVLGMEDFTADDMRQVAAATPPAEAAAFDGEVIG